MELYNPSHVSLPALKINKTREREVMEDDPAVASFLRSNLLLDNEFNNLYLNILDKSKKTLQLIRLTKKELLREYYLPIRTYRSHKGTKSEQRKLMFARERHLYYYLSGKTKTGTKEYNEAIFEVQKEICTKVKKDVTRLSNEIQNKISELEEKKKIELPILSTTTTHACKKCAKIISLDKFKQCSCDCGEKITKISKVKELPLHHFNDRLINFLEMNYWFEHGVDYLLRKKNLQTLVGYHVLGHSGVWHEIDNIAESKSANYRFFCECKNKEVKVNDIFVFSGKMIDIGCTRGYIFTTAGDINKEIMRLARSKNIAIITGALTRSEKSLLQEIKES